LDGIERDADRFLPDNPESADRQSAARLEPASGSASESTTIAMRQDRAEMVAIL
jgi:hypothetical protein